MDYGRADVLVPEKFLDRPNIVAVLKHMRGKRRPEGMTSGRFCDSGFPNGFFDRTLEDGFVEMMSL